MEDWPRDRVGLGIGRCLRCDRGIGKPASPPAVPGISCTMCSAKSAIGFPDALRNFQNSSKVALERELALFVRNRCLHRSVGRTRFGGMRFPAGVDLVGDQEHQSAMPSARRSGRWSRRSLHPSANATGALYQCCYHADANATSCLSKTASPGPPAASTNLPGPVHSAGALAALGPAPAASGCRSASPALRDPGPQEPSAAM